jgi:hypothetical protein
MYCFSVQLSYSRQLKVPTFCVDVSLIAIPAIGGLLKNGYILFCAALIEKHKARKGVSQGRIDCQIDFSLQRQASSIFTLSLGAFLSCRFGDVRLSSGERKIGYELYKKSLV